MTAVTAVLGTELQAAAGDDRSEHYLLSDLHVPADGGHVLQELRMALAAIAARGEAARLFVLGDLFDSYISRRQVRTGVWREVAAALAATADRGVMVHLLTGNRDFLLGTEFAAAARCRLAAGWTAGFGRRRAVLLHGDELCQNDLPYQRAKRWLRRPCTRWAARALPVGVALWVAERARRRSRQVIASGDQMRFEPTLAAVDAAMAHGDLLVFGHIHKPAQGPWRGGEYRVLPAFDREPVLLRALAGELDFVQFDATGRALVRPPYPARTFT